MVRARRSALRRGVTLTEVLVAMFVMSIGMISLLTLFPLGAMQVGQALRDDRATQLARQADAFVRQTWRNDVIQNGGNREGYFWAIDDPYLLVKYRTFESNKYGGDIMRYLGPDASVSWYNAVGPVTPYAGSAFPGTGYGGTPTPAPARTAATKPTPFDLIDDAVRPTPATLTLQPNERFTDNSNFTIAGPSFPVLLDPAGVAAYKGGGLDRGWVGQRSVTNVTDHQNGMRIPRRTCQLVNFIDLANPTTLSTEPATGAVFSLTSLVDDMTFLPNGAPSVTELGRQGRYSWAAVIQRPFNEHRAYAALSILVYDKRPPLPQPGDELVIPPDAVQAAGERTVTITLPNRTTDTSPVLLRRGGWIIDGTIDTATATNTRRQFLAYRVSGFTEGTVGATTTQYTVDLETPLLQPLTVGGTTASQLYLFAGLIEVFTRPQLRPDTGY